MKKYLIIGQGISGKSALQLAQTLDFPAILTSDAECKTETFDTVFDRVTDVILSPGVLPSSPLLQEAEKRQCRIASELQFGADHIPCPMLGITGTNGKTTTVELTTFLLNALGVAARYAGNIGVPLSSLATEILEKKIQDAEKLVTVIEISSFQLEHTFHLPLKAAVLLNVESDHINRYPGGMQEYREVKERIFRETEPGNRLYGITMKESVHNQTAFRILEDQLFFREIKVLNLHDTALSALHNQENLMAALALLERIIPLEKRLAELAHAIKKFKTGDHRLKDVLTVNKVRYIDDSKATNPAAVIAAIQALSVNLPGKIVLLAGGLDKDMDFTVLKPYAKYLRKLVIFGQAKQKVAAGFDCPEITVDTKDMEEAVNAAAVAALPGDIVLLSPATASMDMFKDYKARGDAFAACVRELSVAKNA